MLDSWQSSVTARLRLAAEAGVETAPPRDAVDVDGHGLGGQGAEVLPAPRAPLPHRPGIGAAIAVAQQIPTPGQTPEEVKEWTYYLSWPILAFTVLVLLATAALYFIYSRRFFAKEEPPAAPQRRRVPQFAPGGAATAVAAPPAPSAAGPASPAGSALVAFDPIEEARFFWTDRGRLQGLGRCFGLPTPTRSSCTALIGSAPSGRWQARVSSRDSRGRCSLEA
jgi:hypothetical protein